MFFNVHVEEAREILLGFAAPLPGETVPLLQALDRILYRDLSAGWDLPPGPRAAVDGYAVRREDPGRCESYTITEHLGNGEVPSRPLASGQAAGVVTGGPVPAGTEAVVPRELTRVQGDHLVVMAEIHPGDNIKRPGEDFRAGEVLARRGARVDPGLVGVLAAFGQSEVPVYRRPRLAIISTGEEIVPCHVTPGPGQVRDSNGPLLASLAARDGVPASIVETAGGHSPAGVKERLKKLLKQADLVLTTGGTAAGAGDRALPLLKEMGARVLFWGVGMKPGSHSGAAVLDNKMVISLSGNPAACAVGYHVLAAPVLRALQGLDPHPPRIPARCDDPFPKRGGPRRFIRGYATCRRDGWRVSLLPGQKSSMLRSLIECNVLIDLPAGHPPLEPGTEVSLLPLAPLPYGKGENRDEGNG